MSETISLCAVRQEREQRRWDWLVLVAAQIAKESPDALADMRAMLAGRKARGGPS